MDAHHRTPHIWVSQPLPIIGMHTYFSNTGKIACDHELSLCVEACLFALRRIVSSVLLRLYPGLNCQWYIE